MLKKIIVAIVIFFVPSIVTALFSAVNGFGDLKPDYNVCKKCMTSPHGNYCKNKVIALEYDEE